MAVATCKMRIDSAETPVYIAAMADNINATFEHELKRLEKRVDALVSVCDQLQDENKSLKQRQDVLTSERANLLQKNEQVRARVEAMIGRLKAMEQGS
jgi:cell division protein ZapB